jgi:hypothetical protein
MKAGIVRLFGGASIIAAAVSIFSANAEAVAIPVLPDATYYNVAVVTLPNTTELDDGGYQSSPARVSGSLVRFNGPTSWDVGTSNNFSIPRVSASSQAGPGIKGEAESHLTYYVEFVGAPGTLSVNVQASGGASSAGLDEFNYARNTANASFNINPYVSSGCCLASGLANADSTDQGLHTFSYNQAVTFTANLVYEVSMETYASAWDGQTSTAYVDPLFTLGPGSGYSIFTSSGIGNTASVTPIPAALPLFTSALGGLGLLGWRRKSKAAALAA